jgi:anti-sigma regulatory factor (Ser/Thr protein kinase)
METARRCGTGAELDMRLLPTHDAPTLAREWVSHVLGDISPAHTDEVRLLVSELVTNCVRHADLGPQDSILVSLEVSEGRVKVEVADPGVGFRPLASPAPHAGGGYGLLLLDRVADRWGVRSDGVTAVWFEVDLAESGTPIEERNHANDLNPDSPRDWQGT